MSKTTMTILAATAAVLAVLALGVAVGFAIDSDDVDVASNAPDQSDSPASELDGFDGSPDAPPDVDPDAGPAQIDDFGDMVECLQDSGLGLEDIDEFDMDLGNFFESCIGGLLDQNLGDQDVDPFGFLEEFFAEGGDGGLGGFEEFFDQFEGEFDGFPFDGERLEEFFEDGFGQESETGA